VSCEWDNYDKPNAQLSGNLVYKGEPIGLSVGEVTFQLYEPGWQLVKPIYVSVNQDGAFSALIFDAKYKLIIPSNQGAPFMNIKNTETNSDTIPVTLSGGLKKDIEVMPYYMVRNAVFTASGSVVTGTFKAEKIISDTNAKDIERVTLYINKTSLIDGRSDYNIGNSDLAGASIADPNSITLSLTVPAIQPKQSYVYARVGIKIKDVEKMVFSPVQKVTIQ
jgi:hypothetical protein